MPSNLDLVRLEIGDTDVDPDSDALFSDDEIQVYIDSNASLTSTGGTAWNIKLAAADLCDVLANRFAREYDFSEDGQSFSRGQRSALYAARARQLRKAGGGYTVPISSSVSAAVADNVTFGA